MAKRVALVSLQQALRSSILSLFPVTTLTLITWAFAGSQSGNTSDPLRASIWFWLGAHLIPFKLATASTNVIFNYLPIGALVLPIISIRSSFKRVVAESNNVKAARTFLSFWYALITTTAASFVQSENVKPIIYMVPIYAIAITLLSTINLNSAVIKPAKYLGHGFLLLFGLGALTISGLLIKNFEVMRSIATVVQPGWIGGIILVLLQFLYLPNLISALLAYISGFGFSIGAGTLVAPLTFHLNGLPALPILAALPNGRLPSALFFMAIPVAILGFNTIRISRSEVGIKANLKATWDSLWIFIPLSILLGYQSGGSFLTQALHPFGIKWWSLVCALLVSQIFVTLFFYLLPTVIRKAFKRNV